MHNIDPNDLDAIFREGADSQEYTYNEAAWTDMSARLDERDRRKKYGIAITTILLLVALGGAVLQSIQSTEIQADLPTTDTSTSAIKGTDNNSLTAPQAPNVDGSTTVSTTVSTAATASNTAAASTRTTAQTASSINTSAAAQATAPVTNTDRVADNSVQQPVQPAAEASTSSHALGTDYVTTAITAAASTVAATKDDASSRDLASIDQLQAAQQRLAPATRAVDNTKTATVPAAALLATNSKYFFTMHGAPEWSATQMLRSGKRGWRLGATAGIGLGQHIELYTGFSLSKKVYEGGGADYDMAGGWIDDIMPMTMDAKCYIADLPLGATYYFNGRNEDGFFVDAGVSSYFISSEWYGFDYTSSDYALFASNGIEPVMEVTEQNQSRHFVGVGNLSFGYQKTLASGIHIQVAPYTQIPLTGIGSGKVKLHSSGLRLAMKFSK